MSNHDRIPYAEALVIAQVLLDRLAPVCQRIEIAGSLRRQLPDVGDIELVCIPHVTYATDLFGEPVGPPISQLDAALSGLGPLYHRNGPAYKQFGYAGVTVDLFCVTVETWGVQFMIRTGGEEFSHWLVTSQTAHGALPFGYKIQDGRLWKLGQIIPTPEEADLFAAIGLLYIPPAKRSGHGWFQRGRP